MPLVSSDETQRNFNNSYSSAPARMSAVVQTSRSGQPRFTRPGQKAESLDDLQKSESFQAPAKVLLDYLGTDDDIFETLRDSDWNIFKGVQRAATAGNWPQEVKDAYATVRERFDNADTGSFNQYLEAAKDIGIDIISDPTILATIVAAPFTGGASVAARGAAGTAAKVGIKRLTATKLGAAEGMTWAGVDNFTRQKIAAETGMQDSVSGVGVLASASIGGLLGGGVGKVIDTLAANRAARVLDESRIPERFADDLENLTGNPGIFALRPIAKGVAATLGKPAGVLSSMTSTSGLAGVLQKKLRYDLGRQFSNPINPKARGVAEADFGQTYDKIAGGYLYEIKKIIEPISKNRSGILAQDVNDELISALRTGSSKDVTIGKAAKSVRRVYEEMFEELKEAGLLSDTKTYTKPKKVWKANGEMTKQGAVWRQVVEDFGEDFNDETLTEIIGEAKVENYFKRSWDRKAIENNPEAFKRLLIEDGEAADAAEASDIVLQMLDKKNQLAEPASEVFNASRAFDRITDDTRYTEFLNNDFNGVNMSYFTQASKKLAGVNVFGVKSQKEFNTKWVQGIADEFTAAGKVLSKSEREDIADLYKFSTGEGVYHVEGTLGVLKDWTALGYQVSMLPLATLSSFTEILIPLTRLSVPTYAKALTQGMGAGFKKITIDLMNTMNVKHNMKMPEVFESLNRFMLALDQAGADQVERISGEGLQSGVARKAQNTFFKANFLTQWTQMVQATAFIGGKDLIQNNIAKLSRATDLESSGSIRLRNELSDLGVDYQKGMEWLKSGAKKSDPFYETVQEGASVFTNEIILKTNREAGSKSHIQANPMTDIYFQFLSYPSAFSNTVLKNMATQMAESPIRGSAKVLGAAVIMTEVARFGNYVRSRGESEEGVSDAEARLQGVIRWGGNGLAVDMAQRARSSVEATGSPLGVIAGVTGPLVGEAITSLAYRRGPSQILGTKLPGFGAGRMVLGEEPMDDYTTWLREQDKKLTKIIVGDRGSDPFKF